MDGPANAKFNPGDHVEYHPIGGNLLPLRAMHGPRTPADLEWGEMLGRTGTSTSSGRVERVLDAPGAAGDTGVTVQAGPEDLRYEIRNDKTGKCSAVKEDNIEGVVE